MTSATAFWERDAKPKGSPNGAELRYLQDLNKRCMHTMIRLRLLLLGIKGIQQISTVEKGEVTSCCQSKLVRRGNDHFERTKVKHELYHHAVLAYEYDREDQTSWRMGHPGPRCLPVQRHLLYMGETWPKMPTSAKTSIIHGRNTNTHTLA
jgi:hypothetical protein